MVQEDLAGLTPHGLVADIKDLVTLPEVALRISKLAADPASSANDIGREISKDAALTARLLRVANSAAYGQHGKVATIGRAITVLGVRQVRDLTVGLTAIKTFDGIGNELVTMEAFWRHSVLCGIAAGHLARRRAPAHTDSPFVAGLLHDIGQLVIYSRMPVAARKALLMCVDAADDIGMNVCERATLGYDHGDVGEALAVNWGLPKSLQECIKFHHEPGRACEHPDAVALVHVANSVAVLAEIASTDLGDAPAIAQLALQGLKLTVADLFEVVEQTRQSAVEMLSLLAA